jgi:hypothetical protein
MSSIRNATYKGVRGSAEWDDVVFVECAAVVVVFNEGVGVVTFEGAGVVTFAAGVVVAVSPPQPARSVEAPNKATHPTIIFMAGEAKDKKQKGPKSNQI